MNGEVHGKKAWPVKWHSKVDPSSFVAKPKVGVVSPVTLSWPGPELMLTPGGVVSAVKRLNVL